MSIELPTAVSRYFEADRLREAESVALCFSSDAIVRDESHIYCGHDEILQWKANSTKKYIYTSIRRSIAQEGGRTVVTCHLEGNFPGSPIDLRYFFRLEGDKIGELEITL
jgi:hypothetical protein